MADITKPNTFHVGDVIDAAQVNSDFDTLYSWVNEDAIHADASKAFTGVPMGPNTDPTNDNHLTRKKYVDYRTSGLLAKHVVPNASASCTSAGEIESGVGPITFVMPDLSDGRRAVKLTLSAYSWGQGPNADASDRLDLKMVRTADNYPIAFASFHTINGFVGNEHVEMVGWMFDNGLFAAGATANVRVNEILMGGGVGQSAWMNGSAFFPIRFVAEVV